jgi:hypothetical protein
VSLIERGKKSIPLRRLETAARLLGVASGVITGAPAFYDHLVRATRSQSSRSRPNGRPSGTERGTRRSRRAGSLNNRASRFDTHIADETGELDPIRLGWEVQCLRPLELDGNLEHLTQPECADVGNPTRGPGKGKPRRSGRLAGTTGLCNPVGPTGIEPMTSTV